MSKLDLFGRKDLDWSGKSVFEPRCPVFPRSPNLEMMGQGAGAIIFGQCHQRYGRENAGFSSVNFGFEPEDAQVIDFFRTLVGGRSDNINSSIAKFLNMMARTVIVDDIFVFELQVGRDKETREIVEMNFSPVSAPDCKVFVCGRHVFQFLSSSVAENHSYSRIRRLEPSDTFIFQAPRRCKRILRRAQSALCFFDAMEHLFMDRLSESIKSGRSGPSGYNHSSNLKMLARETAPMGWSGGGAISWLRY